MLIYLIWLKNCESLFNSYCIIKYTGSQWSCPCFFHISLLSSDSEVIMGENNLIWDFRCNQSLKTLHTHTHRAKDSLVVFLWNTNDNGNVLFTFVLGY